MTAIQPYAMIRTLLAGCLILLLTVTATAEEGPSTTGEEIADKLNAVSVHYLELETGEPFSYQRDDSQLIPTFFYQGAAEYLRDDLIEQSVITYASAVVAGLGDVYGKPDADRHRFVLMSTPGQLAQARRFNDDPDFDQVPLFAVRHRDSGEFLTMTANEQTVLPFFIESQRVVQALSLLETQSTDSDEWRIVAIPLATVVSDLHSGRLKVQQVQFIGPQ